MKTTTRTLLIAALLPAVAFCQTTAPKLTTQQEIELYGAINALDQGTTKVVDNKAVVVSFTFSAQTRYALAVDAGLLKPKLTAYQAVVQAALVKYPNKPADAKGNIPANPEADAYLAPLLQIPDPDAPTLRRVALADLQLDSNPINISVLTALAPVITP